MTATSSARDVTRDHEAISTKLDALPHAASMARAFVRAHVVLDSMRQTEADLLVTELISNAIRHAGQISQLEVTVDPSHPQGVKISVAHNASGDLAHEKPGTGFTLMERLSRGWGSDFDGTKLAVWFILRKPGLALKEGDPTDEELAVGMEFDPQACSDLLLRRHTDLAYGIAKRYRGRGIGEDDLRQAAMMGLLKAIQRYDPEVGDLRPYAAATISGEMKRLLRDSAWSVRVPRAIQERVLNVSRVMEELTQRLTRPPTDEELADALGITEVEIDEARFARLFYSTRSIFKESTTTGLTISDHLTSSSDDCDPDDRLTLEEVISSLPERQARIVALRFYEDKTQDEIAAVLGISQMHVSRLLADALRTMRARLAVDAPDVLVAKESNQSERRAQNTPEIAERH